jgi:hypothetical protein
VDGQYRYKIKEQLEMASGYEECLAKNINKKLRFVIYLN